MKDQTSNQEIGESPSSRPTCHATLSQAQPEVSHDELQLPGIWKALLLFLLITIMGAMILGSSGIYNWIRTKISAGSYEAHNDPFAFLIVIAGGGLLLVGAISVTGLFIWYIVLFIRVKIKTAFCRKPPITLKQNDQKE